LVTPPLFVMAAKAAVLALKKLVALKSVGDRCVRRRAIVEEGGLAISVGDVRGAY
jgi:hypothetical protein